MLASVLFAAAASVAQPLSGPLIAIDFYGSAPVDFARLRAALPYQSSVPFDAKQFRAQSPPPEFQTLIGTNRFTFATVYIAELRGWVVYADIEPAGAASPPWKPALQGTARLPRNITALYEHAMDRFSHGGIQAGDETTEGYSLSKDPVMRADELKMIAYARSHASAIYRALKTSGSAPDRIAAAWIAGYAPKNSDQIAALLDAVMDPDSTVRNNAIRVLSVLASHDSNIARRIPAYPFISLLSSLTWSDRNKAMALLGPITAARNPATLESLRRQAIEPLRQMSAWTYWGHASMALVLLGRACGIPEDRLQALLSARNGAAILAGCGETAVHKSRYGRSGFSGT